MNASEEVLAVASRGDLEGIKRMMVEGRLSMADRGTALMIAAGVGQVDVLRYLHHHGGDLTAYGGEAFRRAAGNGHLPVLQYLHQNGVDLDEVGADALKAAAAGRHPAVVRFLHESGAQHSALTEEGRARLQEMADEVAAAPPIYRPSRFWEFLNTTDTKLLLWGGEHNFKRTINENYFNFVPRSLGDPRILNILRILLLHRSLKPLRYRIESPDRDPALWFSWYYPIFRGREGLQLWLYKMFVGSLYEYCLKTDSHGVLVRLEEPELGNPIRIWRDGKLVSQDLVNSVRERNAIVDGLKGMGTKLPPVIGELGGGYGRLGHVLLASKDCRYMVFDIPPALYVSEWYLSRLFPQRKIFRFRPFRAYAEIADELATAEMAFFTANQLELFPDCFFDAFATISSLHEMRREQVDHFLRLMGTKTRSVIYVKQQRRYVNPHDGLLIERQDYTFPTGWKIARERCDILNPGFFEVVARRH